MKLIGSFMNNKKLNKRIDSLNELIQEREELCKNHEFGALMTRANEDNQSSEKKLVGFLNHILTVIRFYDKKMFNILKIDVQNQSKGENPDILIEDKENKKEYAIEIKTIHEKGYDKRAKQYFKVKQEENPRLLVEVPDMLEEEKRELHKDPFYHRGGWGDLKEIIEQMDSQKRNIIMFLTDLSVITRLDQIWSDKIYEINRAYEDIKNGKQIGKEKQLLNALGEENIKKFVETEKIILVSCYINSLTFS